MIAQPESGGSPLGQHKLRGVSVEYAAWFQTPALARPSHNACTRHMGCTWEMGHQRATSYASVAIANCAVRNPYALSYFCVVNIVYTVGDTLMLYSCKHSSKGLH